MLTEVKNTGRQHGIGLSFGPQHGRQVGEGAGAAAGNDRNPHRPTDRPRQRQIIPVLGAVRIHAGQQNLPRPTPRHFLRPRHRIQLFTVTPATRVHTPAPAIRVPLGVNRHHNTLRPKGFTPRID